MQVQKEEIRNKILAYSLDEFYQNGYEKTTMNIIAQRCKISKSNLYRYFVSKEAIYEVLAGPARTTLRKTAKNLTDKHLLTYPREQMIEMMIKELTLVLVQYRKEVIILFHSDLEQDQLLVQDIIKEMFTCFLTFDEEYMPRNFCNVLADMILNGIYKIVEENEKQKDIEAQVRALLRYHAAGSFALAHKG